MSIKERVEEKLTENFSPEELQVIDESHKHEGHAGSRPEGETHFKIIIKSHHFDDLARVKAHKLIFDALKQEMDERIHALSIKIL